ncbi:MAG: hypothetical protein LBL48_02505 [Azoarcus sp.]|jgi:hypothetical protein|nr:hypothetical protein [Azoarcus sp.]
MFSISKETLAACRYESKQLVQWGHTSPVSPNAPADAYPVAETGIPGSPRDGNDLVDIH